MKQILYIIFIILLLIGCRNDIVVDKQLLLIDSLYCEMLDDSAHTIFQKVDTNALSFKDKNYYYVLEALDSYVNEDTTLSFCHLDRAEDFYKNMDNKQQLCKVHLYRAYLHNLKGEATVAAYYGKEAEYLAKELDNDELLIRIYAFMANMNTENGNHKLGITYDNKLLAKAQDMKSKRWIGFALDNLACIYESLGKADSSDYYTKRSIPFIPYMPKKEQLWLLNNASVYYLKMGDKKKAKKLLLAAIKEKPHSLFFSNLATCYFEDVRTDRIERLWVAALATKDKKQKWNTLAAYSKWLYQQHRTKEAMLVNKQIIALHDSIAHESQAEAMQEVQTEYNHNIVQAKLRDDFYLSMGATLFVFLVLVVLYRYNWMRINYMQKQIDKDRELIKGYMQCIEELTLLDEDGEKEIKKLRRELGNVRKHLLDRIAKGKRLYEEIANGGTTVKWDKEDYVNFTEYYYVYDAPFISYLRTIKPKLKPRNFFFLILLKKNYNKDKILHIMGMTDGAYRTAKSRIG